jgi:hypothetical protein
MEQTKVLLAGGPHTLSEMERTQEVRSLEDKLKVPRGNCHDHYAYSGESQILDGATLPVFRWCDRTRVAE